MWNIYCFNCKVSRICLTNCKTVRIALIQCFFVCLFFYPRIHMVLEPCSNNRARAGEGARGLAPPYFLKKLN